MSDEHKCRTCETPVDLGVLFCHQHRQQGLLETYARFNTSEGITKIGLKRQVNTCPNCGYNLMLRSRFCFVCQYDFDSGSTPISKIVEVITLDFLKERKR